MDYYLLDVLRRRLEYPDLKRTVIDHAAKHHPTAVLIEDAGTGSPLIAELRRGGKLRPTPRTPDRDKIVRLEGQTAVIEAGHVVLPQTAPWLEDFLAEILAFPYGRHDDQVDSMSQFLGWAVEHQITSTPRAIVYSNGKRHVYR